MYVDNVRSHFEEQMRQAKDRANVMASGTLKRHSRHAFGLQFLAELPLFPKAHNRGADSAPGEFLGQVAYHALGATRRERGVNHHHSPHSRMPIGARRSARLAGATFAVSLYRGHS
jgi:hypothetical protein